MPRIDPSQLLKCLSVLLSSSGGIKSKDEVNRIANLMTKFSKKLVSKCIYVLILKSTEIDILDMFMSAGGWDLVFVWLSDGITAKNWPLVEEIVELLLLCPVNIQRLKGNNCPKIIKALSRDGTATLRVRELACEVVEQWLAIVKGACEATSSYQQQQQVPGIAALTTVQQPSTSVDDSTETRPAEVKTDDPLPVYKITIRDGKQVLAEVISDKSGSRVDSAPSVDETSPADSDDVPAEPVRASIEDVDEEPIITTKRASRIRKPRILDDLTESETDSSDDDIRPVAKSRKRVQAAKNSAKQDLSKKKRVEEKKLAKEDRAKPKPTIVRMRAEPPKPEIIKKTESKPAGKHEIKSKLEKEMLDKDRATLAKLMTPSISSVGRIPKKSKDNSGEKKEEKKETKVEPKKEEIKKETKKEEKKVEKKPVEAPRPAPKDPKKYNYSTEIRKHDVDRPKTIVKTYNSKFRSTGLEETPPPPKVLKKQDSKEEVKKSPKRASPLKDLPQPEKRARTHDEKKSRESVDRGGKDEEKKITSPKPKTLLESDMFADALTAANTFKDQKRRKRRPSNSSCPGSGKDIKESSPPKKLHHIKEESEDEMPVEKKQEGAKPNLKFYQETLVTADDVKEEAEKKHIDEDISDKKDVKQEKSEGLTGSPVDEEEVENEVTKTEEAISKQLKLEEKKNEEREKNRLVSGILVYVKKRKTIKKSVQWRPMNSLIETKFFELDETERVNVTKTFMDMKQMERINEREQLMLSRKSANDIMEEKIMWRPLIPIELVGDTVEAGKNSIEKDVQFQRERTVVPAIYFSKKLIPDSPAEPDLEIHATTEPINIPLLDQTGNSESVISYKTQGWPEPIETPHEAVQMMPPMDQQPPPMELPPQAMMPPIPPLMDFSRGPPTAFFPPPQMGPPPQGGGPPVGMMPPPMWVNGDGSAMMGPPDPSMMMGPPPGVMPPPPDMPPQYPPMGPPPMNPGQFMGGPPQGYQQPPPPMQNFQDGPPRNNRPWFNNQSGPGGGGGGGGQWRKGSGGNGGGGGGGGWDRSKKNRTCLNIIKRGYCKTPHCSFKHPPPYKPT